MKNFKTFALCTVAALGMMGTSAMAADANFTSHHLVTDKDYEQFAEQLPADEKLELREYLDYEQREPCQGYQRVPQGFVEDGCNLSHPEKMVVAKVETRTAGLRPIVSDYTVYFDFDKSNIRASEEATIDQIKEEIKKYEPYEVTIEGHTDRSGSSDYNYALSQRRADAVSAALTAEGIPNRVLDKEAEGETEPAVPTADGVKLQENRRVEVQFRK